MPPKLGTRPVVVTDWGLPRLCNFILQADGSSSTELAQFYTALEDPHLAVRQRALMPPALTLQNLSEQQNDKAALVLATKLCQHMKPLLAEQGGHFTKVQAAFMAVVATALARWLETGLTPFASLHHALTACLAAHRYIHRVKSSERLHGLAASALCDCAVALVIDWATCQQDLIPEPPASLRVGVVWTLEASLTKGPPDGEPRGLWLLAVPAAARVVEELGLCGNDAIEEAVLLHMAPPLLKTGCWAGLRPPLSLTDPKSWNIVTSIVKGAKYVVGLGLRHQQDWEGSDDGQSDLEDIGNDDGVIAGLSTLLLQLSRLYIDFCWHGWSEEAPCTLPGVMYQITACYAALRAWVEVDINMSEFLAEGMPAIVELLQCYTAYKSGPLHHRAFEGFFGALKLGLSFITSAMLRDVEMEGSEAQDAFRDHGGIEAVLGALESMDSVKEVCADAIPDRLSLMKQLLSCLEAAVLSNDSNQARLLLGGGVQRLLRLVVLDVSAKEEAALKARNEEMARGVRMSAGMRSVLSVVTTLVRSGGLDPAGAPEDLEWNQQVAAKASEAAGAADMVRLLLWEPAPPRVGEDLDYDGSAPNRYSLSESTLTLAALLAMLGPPDALRQLANSRHYLDGLLRVGRNVLRAAVELLASAGGPQSLSTARCAAMPGSLLVLAILTALAETEVDPGWAALPLHWEFLRERPTLGLLRDFMLAAAQRSVLLDGITLKDFSSSDVTTYCRMTGFLMMATKLLKLLAYQTGRLGEELCLAVEAGILRPLRDALPSHHIGRSGMWAKGMEPLIEAVASAAQHAQRIRRRRQQGLQQMEDEAARIAAELIAEEEGEQQRQRQKKVREQSKKQKRKAKKAAAAKQQGHQPGDGAAGGANAAAEEDGAEAAAGDDRGQLRRDGDAAWKEPPEAGWLVGEEPHSPSSTGGTAAPNQGQRSSSAEPLALAAPQWGRAAPGANGQAPSGLALAVHLSDAVPGGAQEHGRAAAGAAAQHPLGPAEREAPGDRGGARDQRQPGEPGASAAAGSAASRGSLAGESAAGASGLGSEPTAGAAAGGGGGAGADGATAARAATAALRGLRLKKEGPRAAGRPAASAPQPAKQQQERQQFGLGNGHPTGHPTYEGGAAAGREAPAPARAAVAGAGRTVGSGWCPGEQDLHSVVGSQADPRYECTASPVVPLLASVTDSGSPVGEVPPARPYQNGTSHQPSLPTDGPECVQQPGHRHKEDQPLQSHSVQPQSLDVRQQQEQQKQGVSSGSSSQAPASPSRARSEGQDASFQELLSYLLPGVTFSPRRSTTQPPSSLGAQPAPDSEGALPVPGVQPLAGLSSAAPPAITAPPPPPPALLATGSKGSLAGAAGSDRPGQWHNSGSHDGGIGISKTCGMAADDPGVCSSAGAAGALTGEAWGLSDRLRGVPTCPLTQHLLVDPVICEDGLSYERSVLQGTQARMRSNFALKQLLDSLGQ